MILVFHKHVQSTSHISNQKLLCLVCRGDISIKQDKRMDLISLLIDFNNGLYINVPLYQLLTLTHVQKSDRKNDKHTCAFLEIGDSPRSPFSTSQFNIRNPEQSKFHFMTQFNRGTLMKPIKLFAIRKIASNIFINTFYHF